MTDSPHRTGHGSPERFEIEKRRWQDGFNSGREYERRQMERGAAPPDLQSHEPPLDVERLARALERTGYTLWDNDAGYVVSSSDVAEVAAEYARLGSQP